MTVVKSTVTLTIDQNDRNKKSMMEHISEQVHGPVFEPVTNTITNVHYTLFI